MKRFLLSAAFLLLTTLSFADPIDLEMAKSIAQPFVKDQAAQPQLVKRAQRTSQRRIAARYEATSPYYIFSRGAGQGFVIVAGDDCLPTVLGYTEQGDFDESNMPPFLSWFLETYGAMIEAGQAAGAGRYEAPAAAATTDRVDIEPLLKTHWHQDWPYNNHCPMLNDGRNRSITGCVATAASQVAYYWRKDLPHETQAKVDSYVSSGGNSKATEAFPKGTPLKWELMKTSYNNEPEEYREAVAVLMAVIGGGAGLDYASSTAGYNNNCRRVFSDVIGNLNGGTENAKDWGEAYDNYSDEAWATLIYNDLVKQRPVLYSGCNANNEGHAVVIDGYQAKNGYFHFNLGWGGQGDGYFTTARGKSPSWGFNNAWQECVTGVYPKMTNMKAEVEMPYQINSSRDNTVKVRLQNNGTLDYKGIYIFTTNTNKKPSALGIASASDKNTATVIPATGEWVEMELKFKPTSQGLWTVYITDEKMNIIASQQVEAQIPHSDLWVSAMEINGNAEIERHSGEHYSVVYNTKAVATIDISNRSQTPYSGNPRMAIYSSTDDGKTFEYVGYKSATLSVGANSKTRLEMTISSTSACPIEAGKLYRGVLVNPINGTKVSDSIHYELPLDTIVRFTLKEPTLEVASFEDGCLAFTGKWDPAVFTTITKRSTYKNALYYDLRQVEGIYSIPTVEANPNAVMICDNDLKADGNNIVRSKVCDRLDIIAGERFYVPYDFKARNVTFTVDYPAGKWFILTTPCDVDVPAGMVARQVDSHTSSGIASRTTEVQKLNAGCSYLVMTTQDRTVLTGFVSNVVAELQENPDPAIVGTYTATTTPAGAMLPNDDETQWFEPVNEGTSIRPLFGYFCASNVTRRFRAYSQLSLDPSYLNLAQTIVMANKKIAEFRPYVTSAATTIVSDMVENAKRMFTDREATASEVRAYIAELTAELDNYGRRFILPNSKHVDFTHCINNPSFEKNNADGWSVGAYAIRSNANQTYKAIGSDGNYFLHSTNGDAISGSVTGLIPGTYRLSAMVAVEEGKTATLTTVPEVLDVDADAESVNTASEVMPEGIKTVQVGANPLGFHYMTEVVIDSISIKPGLDALGITLECDGQYLVDDFRLTYIGQPYTYGDVSIDKLVDINEDGLVDTADILEVLFKTYYSDLNGDGKSDDADMNIIYNYIRSR